MRRSLRGLLERGVALARQLPRGFGIPIAYKLAIAITLLITLGMGLLGFHAIIQRDFPIVLGILVFGVLIRLFGNIFSDVVWALIDPRIRFQ